MRANRRSKRQVRKRSTRAREGMLDQPLASALKQATATMAELKAVQAKMKKGRDTLKKSPLYKQDAGGLKMYNAMFGKAISAVGGGIKTLDVVVSVLGKMDKGAWNAPFKR